MRPARFPPHPTKHRFVDVLQRDVDITRHMPARGGGCDKLVAPVRRMGVENSDSNVALALFDLVQQLAQRVSAGVIDLLTPPSHFTPYIPHAIGWLLAH